MNDSDRMINALEELGWHVSEAVLYDVRTARFPGINDVLMVPVDPTDVNFEAKLGAIRERLALYRRLGAAAYRVLDHTNAVASGASPYGLMVHQGRLVPNEREQQALTRMKELRADGLSLRAIARSLTAEGHVPRRAPCWYPQVIREILNRTT